MRRVTIAVMALAAGCAGTAPAGAATVSHLAGSATIFVDAPPGEANAITISRSGSSIIVQDTGAPPVPSGDCAALSATDVSCPEAGVLGLRLDLGDGGDRAANATALDTLVRAGAGNDVIGGGFARDELYGGPGDDRLDGGDGADELYGEDRNEAGAATAVDRLQGGPGDDRVVGGAGADELSGGPGADRIEGLGGADAVSGDDGGDTLIGDEGDDRLDGGAGDDIVGSDQLEGLVARSREEGNDTLSGGPGDDVLFPGFGPGVLGPDADTLVGGDGMDTVSYGKRVLRVLASKNGAADDGVAGEGDALDADVERLQGGAGDDALVGSPGPDVIDGGAGNDTISGLAGADTLNGGANDGGSDSVDGGSDDDAIEGDGGDDMLRGDAGRDVIAGSDGRDTLEGGAGPDELAGGAGTDTAVYDTALPVEATLDDVAANDGPVAPNGASEGDLLRVESVQGGGQQDTFTGSTDANSLNGDRGEDYIDGKQGADTLRGGAANDVVAARDGAAEAAPVSCGPGIDFAIVDRRDRPVAKGRNRCEHVDDGSVRDPVAGRRVFVEPGRCNAGEALEMRVPDMRRLVPLAYDVRVPVAGKAGASTLLQSRHCPVRLTAAAGPADRTQLDMVKGEAFRVLQRRTRRPETVVRLDGCSIPATAAQAIAASHARRPPYLYVTKVRASRRGTKAAAAAAARRGRLGRPVVVVGRASEASTVRAARWNTTETCKATITTVLAGTVDVLDRASGNRIRVRAGHSYTAAVATRRPRP